jgi:hypothetical protein
MGRLKESQYSNTLDSHTIQLRRPRLPDVDSRSRLSLVPLSMNLSANNPLIPSGKAVGYCSFMTVKSDIIGREKCYLISMNFTSVLLWILYCTDFKLRAI